MLKNIFNKMIKKLKKELPALGRQELRKLAGLLYFSKCKQHAQINQTGI